MHKRGIRVGLAVRIPLAHNLKVLVVLLEFVTFLLKLLKLFLLGSYSLLFFFCLRLRD